VSTQNEIETHALEISGIFELLAKRNSNVIIGTTDNRAR
jgi:hypothetical protein